MLIKVIACSVVIVLGYMLGRVIGQTEPLRKELHRTQGQRKQLAED